MGKDKLNVLVADDDLQHRTMLRTLLEEWGYSVLECGDGQEAVRICLQPADRNAFPDMVLLDVRMPKKNGLEALEEIHSRLASLPIIMMTAFSEVPAAVEAIRKGAYDYLTKPLDFAKLEVILRNAAAKLGLERENATLAASLATATGERKLLGNSPSMCHLEEMILTVAPTEATVLIYGESGTGKELAARSVHNASHRASGPFVAINCGAFTSSLLASELFGHEKGAFTGADKKQPGLFVAAKGGSIFLDEIGEMPPDMQVKLLRVLQEREILSVGSQKAQPIDCRVLAATNRDLAKEVENGNFREDLYYRLNVVSLQMPPLRERREDIPALASNFARRFAARNHKNFTAISEEAMRSLQAFDWPGNVRELENVMERAVILMRGEYIGQKELPERLRQQQDNIYFPTSHENTDILTEEYLPTLEEVERRVIMQTLQRMGNNKTEAAKVLGITRKTLHAKLNRYKLEQE